MSDPIASPAAHEPKGRWLALAALFAVVAVFWGAHATTIGVFLGPIGQAFGIGRGQAALMSTVSGLAMGLGAMISGPLLLRAGAERLLLCGATVICLSFFAASQATSFPMLLACYAAAGIGTGLGVFLPIPFLVSRWFPNRTGMAIGVSVSGFALGAVFLVGMLTKIIPVWGWQGGYLALAGPMLVIGMPIVIGIWLTRPKGAVAIGRQNVGPDRADIRSAFRRGDFWLATAGYFVFGFVSGGLLVHTIPFMRDLGHAAGVAAAVFGINQILSALGKVASGSIADRLGVYAACLMVFGVLAVGNALLLMGGLPIVLFTVLALIGFVQGAPLTLMPLLIIKRLGLHRYGPLNASANLGSTAGSAIGPVSVGIIFDMTGSYDPAFMLMAGLATVVFLMTLMVQRSAHKHPAPAAAAG